MNDEETQLTSLRALIVEDVEDDALLLVDNLQSSGFSVDWRRVDTEQALVEALEQPWDIVFSDFSMPRFSGAKALEVVRRMEPDMPFVFVSGTIGEDTAVEAMRFGAQDYVMKGNLARLAPAVDRELREAAVRRERRRRDQMLRQLSMVVAQAADSVFITDPQGKIEYVNPAFERLTGYSANEVIGKTPAFLRSGLHDDAFYRELWKTVSRGEVYRRTIVNRRKDGDLFYEEKVIAPLKDQEGRATHLVSTGRDITERVWADQERNRLVTLLEATPDVVAIFKPSGQLRYLNGAGRGLLELDENNSVTEYFAQDLYPERMARQLVETVLPAVRANGAWNGESLLSDPAGTEMPVSQVVLAHYDTDGGVEYLSTIARDISEQKRYQAELQYQATHDRLTQLPNRFMLADRVEAALERAKRHGGMVAVIFLDLDNFKRVNDSLGHAAGDALLQAVGHRLRNTLRPSDTVARHGGDEFTVLVDELGRLDDVLVVLQKIREEFERPVACGSHEIYVTFSVGIGVYPHDGNDCDHLLRNADTAMYRAKLEGANQYSFYASDMNERGHELLSLETDLRHALGRGEYYLDYQPQFDVTRGCAVGMEALLRWRRRGHDVVSPGDFVPLLENTGLIGAVGEWVLRQACIDYVRCRKLGLEDVRVSVNVSAVQFNGGTLVNTVRKILEEEEMPPGRLELELTENILMRDPNAAAATLHALHALGVRIAVDDFGTGYSSLAYLKHFPLDVIKIDQEFIQDIATDASDAAIVEASISLAQKLGLEVVAEGVETEQQLDFLRARGCNLIQGYLLGRPVPHAQVIQVLRTAGVGDRT